MKLISTLTAVAAALTSAQSSLPNSATDAKVTDNILMEPITPTPTPTSYIEPNDLFVDREAERDRSHTFKKPPPVTWIEVPPTEAPSTFSKCYRRPYWEKTKAGGWYTTGPPHPSGMPSDYSWNPTSTTCYTD